MLGDGAMTSAMASWWRKAWPNETRRKRPPPSDVSFMESISEFSRRLGERAAQRTAAGPITAAQERQEAIRAYERARRRKQILVGGFVAGGLIALAIASLAPPNANQPGMPPTGIAAAAEPAPPAATPDTTTAAVDPPAQTSPVQIASVTDVPVAPAGQPASEPPTQPATQAAPGPQSLQTDEVREVQRKLRGFGFDPGPIDGTTGRRTVAAVMRYQESRNLPQTGDVDSDLLEMLRQDRAPEVAPPPPRPQYRTRTAARQENPLDRLGRWIDSIVR
jgi:hypothetical protein